MDFSRYTNISKIISKFGGIKETKFNKKLYAKAEESWAQFSPRELELIDSEIATAPQIYNSVVTSVAICIYNMHAFTAVPVKDVIWIYGSTFTQTMNFIPYNKTHSICVMDRNGVQHALGSMSTFGLSRKKPNDERIEIIRNLLNKERKGIIYGYNKEICELIKKDFQGAVELVDKNSL